MPDSNPPQVPNFVPGAGLGRLVTDRYDFQSHIDGAGFRHTAEMIDLSPPVLIASVEYTDVQDAIVALRNVVEPPTIQLATATNPGIIQLTPGSDIGGSSALEIRVSGIRGYPISSQAPAQYQVLTYIGGSWTPATSQGVFTPNGDLGGNSSIQTVLNISGASGTAMISANNLNFISTAAPLINQTQVYSASGSNMTIEAQGVGTGIGNGGNLDLLGGLSSGGGQPGGVRLSIGGNPATEGGSYVYHLADINGKVAGFFPSSPASGLTSGDMPNDTGSGVIYIGNASTPPTASSSTGSIMWSQGGFLNVRQTDGVSFVVGSVPNPSLWAALPTISIPNPAPPDNGTITYNATATSTTSTAITALTVAIPVNTAARMDISFVGKQVGTTNVSEYNYSMGWVNDAGTATPVGSLTSSDERDNVSGAWTPPPVPSVSGGNVIIKTGFNSSTTINWTVVAQFIFVTA